MNKPIVILLIDDDEDDRELFKLALEDVEHSPLIYKTAKSGIEALEVLKNENVNPDFIFLDLNMPQMDGRECLRELKANVKTKTIPVVIFSTSSQLHDIEQSRSLGAIEFITKPSKVSELTNSLNLFLISQLQKLTNN